MEHSDPIHLKRAAQGAYESWPGNWACDIAETSGEDQKVNLTL